MNSFRLINVDKFRSWKSNGNISLLLLIICMLATLIAQLAIFMTGQELRQTRVAITDRQMRMLCHTAMDAADGSILPEGAGKLADVLLAPSSKRITLSYVSRYSDDRSFYSILYQAAEDDGSATRLQRLEFFVPETLRELGSRYPLIYKTNIEGKEYLTGTDIYTSNEEVIVPQTIFLKGISLAPDNDEQLHKKGFSSKFYRSGSSMFSFTGNDTYYGSTVFTCSGSIKIGAESSFPGSIVFIADKGSIRLCSGVRMDDAIIIADKSVVIEPGCSIKGVIYADTIRILGKSDFNLADNIVARLSAKSFIS